PRIVFYLVTGGNAALHRELSERNVDLLVARRFGPIEDEQFSIETLYEDSYVVAAGVQNPWTRRRKIELAELGSESWILPPPESVTGSVAMEAFRASRLDHPRATVVTISPRGTDQSADHRALSHDYPGVRIAVSLQARRDQGLAR